MNLAGVCGIVAPPFEWYWIECRSPNRFSLHSWGVLFHGLDMPTELAQEGERWLLRAMLVFETKKGDPWGPVAEFRIPVAPDGHLWRGDDEGRGTVFGKASSCVGDAEDSAIWSDELPEYLFSALLTVSFMHCKNVDIVDNTPPEALSRKHRRLHGRPLTHYKTLSIEPMRQVLNREGHAEETGLKTAVHICRGHFKTFSPSAPLFGKVSGTYWWAEQVRGSADAGTVEKDYRLRIDQGTLGRPYEPADEHPELATAHENTGGDPDHAGRGLGAHNRTQNLLAEVVQGSGFRARRPKPEEPQYDLAWETPDAVWVAEVKSLTARNELRQMHTAIGQVIDYGHRIDAGERPVRLIIAVERAPQREHWLDECAKHNIALSWPEMFSELLAAPTLDAGPEADDRAPHQGRRH